MTDHPHDTRLECDEGPLEFKTGFDFLPQWETVQRHEHRPLWWVVPVQFALAGGAIWFAARFML